MPWVSGMLSFFKGSIIQQILADREDFAICHLILQAISTCQWILPFHMLYLTTFSCSWMLQPKSACECVEKHLQWFWGLLYWAAGIKGVDHGHGLLRHEATDGSRPIGPKTLEIGSWSNRLVNALAICNSCAKNIWETLCLRTGAILTLAFCQCISKRATNILHSWHYLQHSSKAQYLLCFATHCMTMNAQPVRLVLNYDTINSVSSLC